MILSDFASAGRDLAESATHGANIAIGETIRGFLESDEVSFVEVFLPPGEVALKLSIQAIADRVIPERRRGTGSLRIAPIHAIPDHWADGEPRILWTPDITCAVRDRYARDRFAVGAMPHFCDTQGLGSQHQVAGWAPLRSASSRPGDTVVAISNAAQSGIDAMFRDVLGFPIPYQFRLVPHYVNLQQFRPVDHVEKNALRASLGWPTDATIACFTGRLTPGGKAELSVLLRAFAACHQPGRKLAICGPEGMKGYREHLYKLAIKLGIQQDVLFPGAFDAKLRQIPYQAADFMVFPSDTFQESQALVVWEAAACGVPAIASDWDGIRDRIEDGVTGFLVPTWVTPGVDWIDPITPMEPAELTFLTVSQCILTDEAKFAERMNLLFSEPARRNQMGKAARESVSRSTPLGGRASELVKLFQEALSNAKDETEQARTQAKSEAIRTGIPQSFRSMLHEYATVRTDEHSVQLELTDLGRKVRSGQVAMPIYEDLVVLLDQNSVLTILRFLSEPRWASEVVAAMALPPARAWFHLSVLIKHGLVCYIPKTDLT